MSKPLHIAVTSTEITLLDSAQKLAKSLFLPYIEYSKQEKFDFILALTLTGLYLKDLGKKSLGMLRIDFLQGKLAYRLHHLHNQKQLLAKAVGLKVNFKPTVLDATAGLGSDGFILAQLGCSVTLLERSPVIFALLRDGLNRAIKHPKYSLLSIKLIQTNSLIYLKKISARKETPDIIYLDPMYPHSAKSALAKKEMRFLRQLVGDDIDAVNLLALALVCAKQRVVVKRPRLAPYLAKLKPQHSIFGKQHRLDVYFTHLFQGLNFRPLPTL
ncbi:MAG: class I SAM-dependent methyltransferase [Candidatus Aquirickettsiella gammari]